MSYLACVRRLAELRDVVYPQFATHNAHTVAYVAEVFGDATDSFKYQRLHGMGEEAAWSPPIVLESPEYWKIMLPAKQDEPP